MKKKNIRKKVTISNCVTRSMNIIMQNEVVNGVVTECNDVVTECNLTNANNVKNKNIRRKVNDVITECNDVVTKCSLANGSNMKYKNIRNKVGISNCVTRSMNVKMRNEVVNDVVVECNAKNINKSMKRMKNR